MTKKPAIVRYMGQTNKQFTHNHYYEAYFLDYWQGERDSLIARNNQDKICLRNSIEHFKVLSDDDDVLTRKQALVTFTAPELLTGRDLKRYFIGNLPEDANFVQMNYKTGQDYAAIGYDYYEHGETSVLHYAVVDESGESALIDAHMFQIKDDPDGILIPDSRTGIVAYGRDVMKHYIQHLNINDVKLRDAAEWSERFDAADGSSIPFLVFDALHAQLTADSDPDQAYTVKQQLIRYAGNLGKHQLVRETFPELRQLYETFFQNSEDEYYHHSLSISYVTYIIALITDPDTNERMVAEAFNEFKHWLLANHRSLQLYAYIYLQHAAMAGIPDERFDAIAEQFVKLTEESDGEYAFENEVLCLGFAYFWKNRIEDSLELTSSYMKQHSVVTCTSYNIWANYLMASLLTGRRDQAHHAFTALFQEIRDHPEEILGHIEFALAYAALFDPTKATQMIAYLLPYYEKTTDIDSKLSFASGTLFAIERIKQFLGLDTAYAFRMSACQTTIDADALVQSMSEEVERLLIRYDASSKPYYREAFNRKQSYYHSLDPSKLVPAEQVQSIYDALFESLDIMGWLPSRLNGYEGQDIASLPGGYDSLTMYQGKETRDQKQALAIFKLIKKLCYHPSDDHVHALATYLEAHKVIHTVDALRHLLTQDDSIDNQMLLQTGFNLATQTASVECVKLGLTIMSLFNLEDAAYLRKIVETLGKYDEFTFYALFTIRKYADRNEIDYEYAAHLQGWGRIHALQWLDPDIPRIKRWMLTSACNGEVLNEYAAAIVAQKLDLYNLLDQASIDYNTYQGVCAILKGLMSPTTPLIPEQFSRLKKTIALFLNHAKVHCSTKEEAQLLRLACSRFGLSIDHELLDVLLTYM